MDREKKRQEHDEQERIRRHSTKKSRKDTSQQNSRQGTAHGLEGTPHDQEGGQLTDGSNEYLLFNRNSQSRQSLARNSQNQNSGRNNPSAGSRSPNGPERVIMIVQKEYVKADGTVVQRGPYKNEIIERFILENPGYDRKTGTFKDSPTKVETGQDKINDTKNELQCPKCKHMDTQDKFLPQAIKNADLPKEPIDGIQTIVEEPVTIVEELPPILKIEVCLQTSLTILNEPELRGISDEMIRSMPDRLKKEQSKRTIAEESLKTMEQQMKVLKQQLAMSTAVASSRPTEAQEINGIIETKTIKTEKEPKPFISTHTGKLSDATILRILDTAMEDMIRFEVSEASPYAFQLKKIFDFKDYLVDHLMMHYGLRNLATRHFDFILERLFAYSQFHGLFAIQVFNCLAQPYPKNTEILWSINKQHVAIYAFIVFNDVLSLTLAKKQVSSTSNLQTEVKKYSKLDNALLMEAFSSGGQVNIFDLLEVVGKKHVTHNNPMVKKIIEGLRPGSRLNESEAAPSDKALILEQLRMKLTAKVARHGFDLRYFFETIDVMGRGTVKFVQFMAVIKDRFNLQLSPEEIEAIFLYFSPQHAQALQEDTQQVTISSSGSMKSSKLGEPIELRDIDECQVSISTGQRSLNGLLYQQGEFHSKLKDYMITKAQFTKYVLSEYDLAMRDFTIQVSGLFHACDSPLKRGGLDAQQFQTLLTSPDLKQLLGGGGQLGSLYKRLSITQPGDEVEVQSLFDDALEFLEENEHLKELKLLGLDAVKEIVLERNLESLPFYNYIQRKYNSAYIRGAGQRVPPYVRVIQAANALDPTKINLIGESPKKGQLKGSKRANLHRRSLSPQRVFDENLSPLRGKHHQKTQKLGMSPPLAHQL